MRPELRLEGPQALEVDIDGYPQSFAKPAPGVSCLEVLRGLRSTKSERPRQ